MRTFRVIAILLITVMTMPSAMSQAKQKSKEKKPSGETIKLFNGKNLENWVFQLKDPSVDPAGIFTVQNGIINIKGEPFGYMRTKEKYSDYRLHVEWRWPSEPTNSGVFVHGQTPDAIWLRCVECQLKAGNAGDFVCMNGAEMDQHKDKSTILVPKFGKAAEKPAGKWNTMEVICRGNTIEVSVNGIPQNKATNVNLSEGSICLQSEGKDIQFRNVFLTKLR